MSHSYNKSSSPVGNISFKRFFLDFRIRQLTEDSDNDIAEKIQIQAGISPEKVSLEKVISSMFTVLDERRPQAGELKASL